MNHILIFVLIYCGMCITCFFHELGHALTYLFISDADVTILMGDIRNAKANFKIGRISIGFKDILNLHRGVAKWDKEITSDIGVIIFMLAGPLANLVVLILLLFIRLNYSVEIIIITTFYLILFTLSQFLSTIIPREYKFGYFKGMKSDGYKAVAAIKRLVKTNA